MQRALLYVIFLLLTLVLGGAASQLRFDPDIERLFPDQDPELAYFRQFREAFSNENDYLGIALVNEEGIFRPEFLGKVHSLCLRLEALDGVERVSGLTRDSFLRIGPLGTRLERPLLRPDRSQGYAADSAFLFSLPLYTQIYLSGDARSTCIYLKVPNAVAYGAQGDSLLAQVRREIAGFPFDAVYLTGGFYAARVQGRQLKRDLLRLSAAALLLITLAFAWAFRSLKMVILPLLVIGAAVTWTLGLMALLGGQFNLMTVLLPALLFVVGSSDVIHLSHRYREALEEGMKQDAAITCALREVGRAAFLTSVTTAAGFLTLAGVGVAPVRQLGLFGALGIMLTLGITLILLPAGWRWLSPSFPERRSPFSPLLERLLSVAIRQRVALSLAFVALLLGALIATSQLKVQAFFTDELPGTARELTFFEQHYGGLRPFAMGVTVPGERYDVFSPPVLRQMDRLDAYLKQYYGVNRMATLVNYFKAAHCSLHNGDPEAFVLPESDVALAALVEGARRHGESHGVFEDWVSRDRKTARVAGSLPDLGLREWQRQNEALREFVERELDSTLVQVRITGAAHLIDRSHRMISLNMLAGLLLALAAVALLMGLLFRSWRIMGIALLVNTWPLALVAGLLGISGTGLKMSTAIVFTLALGIAVDDTLHVLSRLHLERRKGPGALRRTYRSTGTALLLTSLVLAAGFGVLAASAFPGTRLTGLLIGLALILALAADLLWLPALLREDL